MESNSIKYLYRQLQLMEQDNKKESHIKIISEEEFNQLSDAQKLSYVFFYRDTQTLFINEAGEVEEEYIEIPDIDLSNQDLRKTRLDKKITHTNSDVVGVTLSKFVPIMQEKNGNKRLSNINLNGTNAVINLSNLLPTRVEFNEVNTRRFVIDFSTVNFKGCNLFGMLPDEYLPEDVGKEKLKERFKVVGKENLEESYIARRTEKHLTPDEKKIADKVYKQIQEGKNLTSERTSKTIRLTDYDLSGLNSKDVLILINAETLNRGHTIECNYTGLVGEAVGYENFRKLSLEEKKKVLYHRVKIQDWEYVRSHLSFMDKESIYKVSKYLIELGNTKIYDDIDKKTFLEIIDSNIKKLSDDEKYQLFISAFEKKNWKYVSKYLQTFDGVAKKRIYGNKFEKKEVQLLDIVKKLIAEKSQEGVTPEEIEEIDKALYSINIKGLELQTQNTIMIHALVERNFDYISKNIENCRIKNFVDVMIRFQEINELDDKEKEQLDSIVFSQFNKLDARIQYKLLLHAAKRNNINFISQNLSKVKTVLGESFAKAKHLSNDRKGILSILISRHMGQKNIENYQNELGKIFPQNEVEEVVQDFDEKLVLLSQFLTDEVKIQDGENYAKRILQKTDLFADGSFFKMRSDKEKLTRLKDMFDKVGATERVFRLEENDPQEKEKISLLSTNEQFIYSRLMFFNKYSYKFVLPMDNPNFVWRLGMSSERFINKYLMQTFPEKIQFIRKQGLNIELETIVEMFPMPINYQNFLNKLDKVQGKENRAEGKV